MEASVSSGERDSAADLPVPDPAKSRGLPAGRRALLASAAYSLGFIVQRAFGMVLLPFYTRSVTPEQYGVLGLLLSMSMALAVILALGLDTAVTRNYFQLASQPDRRDEYVSSVWRFLVIYPLAASLGLSLALLPAGSLIHGASELDIALMLASTALGVAGTTVPLAVLRARQDLRGYVWVTAAVSLATPLLTCLFVVVLHQGVRGWFLASAIANALTFLVALRVVPWRVHTSYSGTAVKGALIFSLPLLPHFLSHWALLVADRLVISGMVSATSLGVYTLAANLSAPMFALLQAINSGFVPTYGRAGAEAGHEETLAKVVDMQIAITIAVTLAACLLGRSAVGILTPRSYHGAANIVVWLMLGNGFVGLYFVPMNGATIAAGRRIFAFFATMAAAFLNIGLLVVFVPSGGITAAAIADAAAYFALLVLMAVWAHSKPNPVTYRWGHILSALLLATGVYVGCVLTVPPGVWDGALVELGWVGAFLVLLLGLHFRDKLCGRLFARLAPAGR